MGSTDRRMFVAMSAAGSLLVLVAAMVLAGCGGGASHGASTAGGSGGDTGGTGADTGGAGGSGGVGGISGIGGGGAGGSGGQAPSPDARGTDETPVDAAAGAGGSGGGDDAAPASDTQAADAGACGQAGQACCPDNSCAAGATPSAGAGGGMTVLELVASGSDPYALFKAKDLLPIDGPAAGYITDTGTSFKFVLHQTGAEETVSSGAKRQRNELTVNPGNPVMYKGLDGTVMSYTWRFHLDTINAHPTWCDIFQIKQHGPLGVAPLFQFRTQGDNLDLAFRLTTAKSIPLTAILGQWISATITIKYGHAGTLELHLKKEDGSSLIDYVNNNADMWDTNVDFVRPKWGLYRNQAAGAGEASIQYNNMRIIKGTIPGACVCH